MPKRKYEEIRKDMLNILSDGKLHSYSDLERKTNTNWITIRTHAEELHLFEAAEITDKGVLITDFGHKILKKLKK